MKQTKPSPAGARVRLSEVTKSFPLGQGLQLAAVSQVSLTIDPGSVLAITGPSGSGKSTLLHLIGAIDRPDHGLIEVDGQALNELSRNQLADYRRRIGFVFQRYNLLPTLTALDNVLTPVLPYRTSYDKAGRAADLLAQVGLAGRERALPSRLSGGEQQRVGIARALIGSPRLLLADEPTGNLDSHAAHQIFDTLASLATQGKTVVFVTHDRELAVRSTARIELLDGRIVGHVGAAVDVAPAAVEEASR